MTAEVPVSGSIRRRLILQLVGSAALLAVLLFLLVQNFARQVAVESQDSILVASATSIADAVRAEQGEIVADIPYSALSMLGNVSDDRVFYRIAVNGEFLTGYEDLPPPGEPGASVDTLPYRGSEVRVVAVGRRLSVQGGLVQVEVGVAQTRSGQAAVLAEISRTAAALGLGFFALAVLLGVAVAQGTVRPLRRLAGSVSRRGPKDLRPVTQPTPAEMVPLVTALNGFMARLAASLSRSEDFIAEAAHRVRTPLATVRTQAEVALRRVERPENRHALKEMIRAVDESSRSAGQLLDHAMVTFRTDHLDRERVDLCALAGDTAHQAQPMAELRDVRIETDTPSGPVEIEGDEILIQNAVRNIIDNALKYGPPDSHVTVGVCRGPGDGAMLTVCDRGKGFPEGAEEALKGRFARGDNAAHVVGSGLGLTIAEEVMRAHGGHLAINRNEKGQGACVSLVFPSA